MFLGVLCRVRIENEKQKTFMRTMRTAFLWVITQRVVVISY